MFKQSDFIKDYYRAGEAARLLGVTTKTIREYDLSGKLESIRTIGGHRLIKKESILNFLAQRNMLLDDSESARNDIVYARVSSHEQKEKGDLDRQVARIVESFSDLRNPIVIREIGSGLNDNRKGIKNLIKKVAEGNVRYVVVTHRDRLTRFGFNYLKDMFSAYGTEIVSLFQESSDRDAQEELVDDMMSLIVSFSGKLYGMRSGQRKKNENN